MSGSRVDALDEDVRNIYRLLGGLDQRARRTQADIARVQADMVSLAADVHEIDVQVDAIGDTLAEHTEMLVALTEMMRSWWAAQDTGPVPE